MANAKQIQFMLDSIRKIDKVSNGLTFSPQGGSTINPLTGLQNQVENASTRLAGAGIDPDQYTDKRTQLEKWLNLPEDQNWVFDIFELVNRSQNSLFGAATEALEGGDWQEGLDRGFSGKETYSGGQIVRDIFQDGKRETGELDWTDFVGGAMEVVLDPADLALGFVTGGASVVASTAVDAAKAADIAVDAVKIADNVADGLKVADGIVDASNAVDAIADGAKVVGDVKTAVDATKKVTKAVEEVSKKKPYFEFLKESFVPKGSKIVTPLNDPAQFFKLSLSGRKARAAAGVVDKLSLSDFVFRPMLATGKWGVQSMDSFIEHALGYMDESSKTVMDLGDKAFEDVPMLAKYRALKKQFSSTIKRRSAELGRVIAKSGDRWSQTLNRFGLHAKEYDAGFLEAAKLDGIDINDKVALRQFSQDVMNAYEADELSDSYVTWNTLVDKITNAPKGERVLHFDQETFDGVSHELLKKGINPDDAITITKMGEFDVIKFNDDMFEPANRRKLYNGVFSESAEDIASKGVKPVTAGVPLKTNVDNVDYTPPELTVNSRYNPEAKSINDVNPVFKGGSGEAKFQIKNAEGVVETVAIPRSQGVQRVVESLKSKVRELGDNFTKQIDDAYQAEFGKLPTDEERLEYMEKLGTSNDFRNVNLTTNDYTVFAGSISKNLNDMPEWVQREYRKIKEGGTKIYHYMNGDIDVRLNKMWDSMSPEERIKEIAKIDPQIAEANKIVGRSNRVDIPTNVKKPDKAIRVGSKKIGQLPSWEESEVSTLRTFLKGLANDYKTKIDPLTKAADHFFGLDDYATVGKRLNKKMSADLTEMLQATTVGRRKIRNLKKLDDVLSNDGLLNSYIVLGRLDRQFGTSFATEGIFKQVDDIMNALPVDSPVSEALRNAMYTKRGFYESLRTSLDDAISTKVGAGRVVLRSTEGKEMLKLKDKMSALGGLNTAVVGKKALASGTGVFPEITDGMKFYNNDKFDIIKALSDKDSMSPYIRQKLVALNNSPDITIKLGDNSMSFFFGDYKDEFDLISTFLKRADKDLSKSFEAAFQKAMVNDEYDDLTKVVMDLKGRLDFDTSKGKQLDKLTDDLIAAHPEWRKEVSAARKGIAKAVPGASYSRIVDSVKDTASPDGIKVTRLYTDQQRAAIAEALKKPGVRAGMDNLRKTITNIQETIGEFEFDNKSALTKTSMKDYVPHVITDEVRKHQQSKSVFNKIRESMKGQDKYNPDMLNVSLFAPGKTSYNKARMFDMSALEANNLRKAYYQEMLTDDEWFKVNVDEDMVDKVKDYFSRDLFQIDARASVMDFMTTKYNAMNYNHKNTGILLAMSVGKPDSPDAMIKQIKSVEGTPKGFTSLKEKEALRLRGMLRDSQTYMPKEMKKEVNKLINMMNNVSRKGSNVSVIVEDHIYKALNITQHEGFELVDAIDSFTSVYKKFKTLSPAFNIKNVVGNMTNMWMAGMSVPDVIKSMTESYRYIHAYKGIAEKVTTQGLEALSGEEAKIFKYYNDFLERGFFTRESASALQDLGRESLEATQRDFLKTVSPDKKAVGGVGKMVGDAAGSVFKANLNLNLNVDRLARMGMYIHVMENPEYLAKLGVDNAMDAVRMVLFDPNDLTFFEQDVMKRLIPFYTFTRQNLAFQAKNLVKNSDRYYKVWKGVRAAWRAGGTDTDNLRDYEKDQMYIPVPMLNRDGKYTAVKLNMPMSDIFEFAQDPGRKIVNALSPLLKTPIELSTGTSTLSGRPIEDYQGQMSKSIPYLTKKQEYMVGQSGVDVPLRVMSNMLKAAKETSKSKGTGEDVARGLLGASGMLYEGSEENNMLGEAYEELDALQAVIRKYKDAGDPIPELQDSPWVKKQSSTKQKLDQIAQILDKYR